MGTVFGFTGSAFPPPWCTPIIHGLAAGKKFFTAAEIVYTRRVAEKKWRVLVVDDCKRTTELIKEELDGKGFEVHLATTVDQATRLILREKTRPDIVLLDVIMPGVNGEQFCRFIKRNELFSGITVVLCSGMDKEELRGIAQKCGADGFVHKESFLGKETLAELLRQQREPE